MEHGADNVPYIEATVSLQMPYIGPDVSHWCGVESPHALRDIVDVLRVGFGDTVGLELAEWKAARVLFLRSPEQRFLKELTRKPSSTDESVEFDRHGCGVLKYRFADFATSPYLQGVGDASAALADFLSQEQCELIGHLAQAIEGARPSESVLRKGADGS